MLSKRNLSWIIPRDAGALVVGIPLLYRMKLPQVAEPTWLQPLFCEYGVFHKRGRYLRDWPGQE